MTDDEELIARLRKADEYEPLGHDGWEAADRIEALTEQLTAAQQDAKEAEAYAEELEKELNTCRMAQAVMDNTVADLEDKLSKTEGLLAKAVEALEYYAGRVTYRLCDDCPVQVHKSADLSGPARATLAAVSETHKIKSHSDKFATQKGESHE